jgi:hypothetical protein
MADEASACPECGRPNQNIANSNASSKNVSTATLLCAYLGLFGAHRFYVGKIGTGVIQLLTGGGLGIWLAIDLMMLCRFSGLFHCPLALPYSSGNICIFYKWYSTGIAGKS